MKTALVLALVIGLSSASNTFIRHTPDGCPNDPLKKHCCDVSVDLSDPSPDSKPRQWLSANEYQYDSWKDGLCDSTVFPSVESKTHPGGINEVTLRKCGHAAETQEPTLMAPAPTTTSDCRSDKTSKPISIKLTNAAGTRLKIKGCQNQYACNPHVNCDPIPTGGTTDLTIDASFKYMIFTFDGSGKDVELYPDANMMWKKACTIDIPPHKTNCTVDVAEVIMLANGEVATETTNMMVLHLETPGNHAHCNELFISGGKNNAYWQAHGYQLKDWKPGLCAEKYNWFNKNTTIAPGVVEELRGIHTN